MNDEKFVAKVIGGNENSDICVSNIMKNKHVFIECKLDFASSEYFKFTLKVQNGKLKYDHHFHLRNLNPEDREKMDLLFSKDLDISGFLNEVV